MEVIVKECKYKDITYNEYMPSDSKGLVFFQHGFTSNKEDGGDAIALSLARTGLTVVCIDSYMHGMRFHNEKKGTGLIDERLLYINDVIIHTTSDIESVFKNVYSKDYCEYTLIGFSLGAFITYYMVGISKNLKGVAPLFGSPYFFDFMNDWTNSNKSYIDDLFGNEHIDPFIEILKNAKELDPSNNISNFDNIPMFVTVGLRDQVILSKYSIKFYNEMINRKKINIELNSYDSEHTIHRTQLHDLKEWIIRLYQNT